MPSSGWVNTAEATSSWSKAVGFAPGLLKLYGSQEILKRNRRSLIARAAPVAVLARLVLDAGYGPEAVWEPEPVTVALGGVSVPFPPGSFLQATLDGEQALVAAACEWLDGCGAVADLFAGLGTFAFALAGQGAKVLAVEAARDAHLACKAAAGRLQLPRGIDHVRQHRPSRDRLQHLGQHRFHAFPGAGSKDDHVQWLAHVGVFLSVGKVAILENLFRLA